MLPRELREALIEDLGQLVRLHDRELDAETWAAMQETAFPDNLALLPGAGRELLRESLREIPTHPGLLEALAVDYAAIYLTGALGASPCESVWVSEEHLNCESPMFELAQLYADHGLRIADRCRRYDDHLVCQLQFLQHLLSREDGDPAAMANFIDEHLGYWIADFAGRVAMRCDAPFYAGLAMLTAAWIDRLRDCLAELMSQERPSRAAVAAKLAARRSVAIQSVAPIRFMPGTGPSL